MASERSPIRTAAREGIGGGSEKRARTKDLPYWEDSWEPLEMDDVVQGRTALSSDCFPQQVISGIVCWPTLIHGCAGVELPATQNNRWLSVLCTRASLRNHHSPCATREDRLGYYQGLTRAER
jgi:hypothetical protein